MKEITIARTSGRSATRLPGISAAARHPRLRRSHAGREIRQEREPHLRPSRLFQLIPEVAEAFIQERITASHANLIARIPQDRKPRLMRNAGAKTGTIRSALFPRNSCRRGSNQPLPLTCRSAFDREDPTLNPAAGACTTCPRRSGYNTSLFSDVRAGPVPRRKLLQIQNFSPPRPRLPRALISSRSRPHGATATNSVPAFLIVTSTKSSTRPRTRTPSHPAPSPALL